MIMKNVFFLFVCAILFSACHQSKTELVNDFLDAKNCFDEAKVESFLADNFKFYMNDTLNKSDYLTDITGKKELYKYKSSIIEIQELDSIVKTKERISNILDSLLDISPKVIQYVTYRFSDDKIKSIKVDSVPNYEEYSKASEEKIQPFLFYVYDQHGILDAKEILSADFEKYLTEYASLSVSDRKKYTIYWHLQGTYVSKKALYSKLIFRGRRTVTVYDAFFGFPFTSSYDLDENYIRIRTNTSDLLLEIQDSKTLVGDGWARGIYTKVE